MDQSQLLQRVSTLEDQLLKTKVYASGLEDCIHGAIDQLEEMNTDSHRRHLALEFLYGADLKKTQPTFDVFARVAFKYLLVEIQGALRCLTTSEILDSVPFGLLAKTAENVARWADELEIKDILPVLPK